MGYYTLIRVLLWNVRAGSWDLVTIELRIGPRWA